MRAQIAYASSRSNEAPRLLLAAAERLEPLDIELARETYLNAFSAALYAGRFARAADLAELAAAVPRATWAVAKVPGRPSHNGRARCS